MSVKVGIEYISFYVPSQYLALETLAHEYGTDPEKFSRGIEQDKIAIPEHHEDIVTMGAEAAAPIIEAHGKDNIDTLLFATETGIDQSKSAGIYVHRLLGLSQQFRNVELKQACYSSTAALQMACGYVARRPDRKVLIIASDISRYDLNSPGEATQGAGAVAMLISADPRVMEIEPLSGCHSEDIMDFWRPNYRKTPFVDGKYSAIKYLQSLAHAWDDYRNNGGHGFSEFTQFCYHLPFTRMAEKAHRHLSSINKAQIDRNLIHPGMVYNRQIGNCYNASLYISLISMLENYQGDLGNSKIGIFSYGSGATAEFFSGVVQEDYQEQLFVKRHRELLDDRRGLDYQEYLKFWHAPDPQDGDEHIIAKTNKAQYRLSKIHNHKRYYESAA
ncbi:MAG: hydroxymethylglutaryl-CoA synthase [Bdellovibrionales bacterium]